MIDRGWDDAMLEIEPERAAFWNLRNLGLVEPFGNVHETTDALVAVQAQSYGSVKRALEMRTVCGFNLDSELSPGGGLVRMWTVRGTLHIVPAGDAALHLSATREDWDARWGRYLKRHLADGLETAREEIYPRIAESLGREPLTHKEIAGRCGLGMPYAGLLPHIMKDMCYLGLCVRGPQPRGKSVYFAPPDARSRLKSPEARAEIIRRFIGAYGPVTGQDISYWTGFRVGTVGEALGALGKKICRVLLTDRGCEAHMLVGQPEAAEEVKVEKVPRLLLPAFDALLLAYKDKSRFMAPGHLKRVFGPAGRVEPVVLRNGRVIGTWNEPTGRLEMF